MALPKLEHVKYEKRIEELGKTVHYRAFTHREHKLILQAIEFKDEKALINTILDIIDVCTFGELEIEELPVHIIDYLYTLIHAKSIGQNNTATYLCKKLLESEETKGDFIECGKKFNIKMNLDKIEIEYPENYESSRIVFINKEETAGIKLKIPSFKQFKNYSIEGKSTVDVSDAFVYWCVDSIFDESGINKPEVDFTFDEFTEWVEGLETETVEKISAFFLNIPAIVLRLPVTCPCGKNKDTLELRGLESFFV